jgi:hypothetical protein
MNKMKEEYKDFVGIYDESVPVKLCDVFVNNWEEAKKNRTIIDVSQHNEKGILDKLHPLVRKDEVAFVYPLTSTLYPIPPVKEYFNYIMKCFECYIDRYSIVFDGIIVNHMFKIHKVKKTEGFHQWHYEKPNPDVMDRVLVYMTYLEVPEKGGETEFLHQSLRVEPIVGRTLIWPAGFTHMHRGNSPLDGEKMYIDGWLNIARTDDGRTTK